ncbi:MAG: hypothetical protein M1839_001700 [Geoglossum umbratile]|nr:MAG: hypothetical protein M1839_001700 [Geoglossum umbratile]
MRLATPPILALSLAFSAASHPTQPDRTAQGECKTPALSDCLRLADLISNPNWRGLSFSISPGGFSPAAYYGSCALAAVYTGGEVPTQAWGEAAEAVRDMVDRGLQGELPIARDVESANRGVFALVLTVSAGDVGAWEEIVDGCMADAMAGRGRAKPDHTPLPVFSPDVGAFRSEQQPILSPLPSCGLAGIYPLDGSRYGCVVQAIPQDTLPIAPLGQSNPLSQLIARCPHGSRWLCRASMGTMTCNCVAPHHANVTKLEVLAQLFPGNNNTVISVFEMECMEDEVVSCFRIIVRPFQCGCSYRRLIDVEDGVGLADLPFQLVEWPTCGNDLHLKCCPGKAGPLCYCGKGLGCPKK